jgi:(p)ppGpp synthase/HD superfamily hydrolase
LYVLGVTTPEQLLAMPLHAVTEVYGEAGLRERFALEVAGLPGRSTMEDALVWAAALHADQRRTREPYLNHVLRVAIRILTYYRVTDPEVIGSARVPPGSSPL